MMEVYEGWDALYGWSRLDFGWLVIAWGNTLFLTPFPLPHSRSQCR